MGGVYSNYMTHIPTAHLVKYPVLYANICSIETPEMAYVLGLLWADGHLECKNTGRLRKLSLTLIKEDFEIIQPTIEATGEWIIKPKWVRNADRNNHEARIAYICSTVIMAWFYKMDYHIKSGLAPIKILSHLPEHLRHYWWRGYFDGDGCLGRRKYGYRMSITSTIDQDWTFAQEWGESLGVKFTIDRKSGRYSQLSLNMRSSILKCMSYLYAGKQFGLQRKWAKYQDLLAHDVARALKVAQQRANPMRWISHEKYGNKMVYRFQFRKLGVFLAKSPPFLDLNDAIRYKDDYFRNNPNVMPSIVTQALTPSLAGD